MIPTYDAGGHRCVVAYVAGSDVRGMCGSQAPWNDFDEAVPVSFLEVPTCMLCIAALETWDSM